jgi:hypothetical protein
VRRVLAAARVGPALACLLAPARVLGAFGAPVERAAVVRLLGARELAQAAAIAATPRALPAAAGVDVLHALSMLGLAALAPRYRTAALAAGGSALAWAALERGTRPGTVRSGRATVEV